MTEPVKQVVFGGVLVPENAKRDTVVNNGQTMYCVWLNDKGAKITYPEHQQKPVTTKFIKTIQKFLLQDYDVHQNPPYRVEFPCRFSQA